MSRQTLSGARAVNKEKKFGGGHGTGPDAASLVKKLRRVWTQRVVLRHPRHPQSASAPCKRRMTSATDGCLAASASL
jgi:hypothetical protein